MREKTVLSRNRGEMKKVLDIPVGSWYTVLVNHLMCLPDDLQQLPFIALLLLVQLRYQRFDLRVAFVLLWLRSSSGCALALRYNRTGDRSRAGICTGSPFRTG